jgi:hypothetical protein
MMLSRDKVLTKRVLSTHGVATPAFRLFPFGRRFREPARLTFPLFVKSATEDASLGIAHASLVEDGRGLRERVQFIHEQIQSDALVESYIDGRELYVGVLGNSRLTTLPPWEMRFGTARRGIATRKAKWDRNYQAKHGIETGPAAGLSGKEQEQLSRLAKTAYRALHMSGFARMDFRLSADGRIYLLEANANPNLSNGEDRANAARAASIYKIGSQRYRQHAGAGQNKRYGQKPVPPIAYGENALHRQAFLLQLGMDQLSNIGHAIQIVDHGLMGLDLDLKTFFEKCHQLDSGKGVEDPARNERG